MPFEWPNDAQIAYRLIRLRRLLAVAIAVPVAALMFFGPIGLDPVSGVRLAMAVLAIAALVAGHAVLFPNAGVETLALSGVLALFVGCVPTIKAMAQYLPFAPPAVALVLAIALAMMIAAALLVVLHIALGALICAGPRFALTLRARVDIPCSPDVARAQYALRPSSRRGRIRCGAADETGLFPVAVTAPQLTDPNAPDALLAVHSMARVMRDTPTRHEVMLIVGDGAERAVTVTAERFAPAPGGCRVSIAERPGDFTAGLYAMFWLTDQQADNLTETADPIRGIADRCNGLAHGQSLSSLAAGYLGGWIFAADRAD